MSLGPGTRVHAISCRPRVCIVPVRHRGPLQSDRDDDGAAADRDWRLARGALRRQAGAAGGAALDDLGDRERAAVLARNVEIDYERDLGRPGEFPFTRGVYPSMYRGRLWTMRQFAGFGTAEETNERFRYLLEHGQTGLSTAFDMPTLMGYDSRSSALARRGRPRGRRDRLARGHGDAVRRDPARRGVDVDDDQRAGGDAARVLRLRGGGAGRAARVAARDGADGHPQGVHRAEGVDLPAGAVDAARRRT